MTENGYIRARVFPSSRQPSSTPKMTSIYKESVELTFVYPNEGCGKTLLKITDTIPHTVVDMEYQGAECTYPHVSTRSECCPFRPYDLENFHIFDKGLAKNTFTICNIKGLHRLTRQS